MIAARKRALRAEMIRPAIELKTDMPLSPHYSGVEPVRSLLIVWKWRHLNTPKIRSLGSVLKK
jgi:hypothetical protein